MKRVYTLFVHDIVLFKPQIEVVISAFRNITFTFSLRLFDVSVYSFMSKTWPYSYKSVGVQGY